MNTGRRQQVVQVSAQALSRRAGGAGSASPVGPDLRPAGTETVEKGVPHPPGSDILRHEPHCPIRRNGSMGLLTGHGFQSPHPAPRRHHCPEAEESSQAVMLSRHMLSSGPRVRHPYQGRGHCLTLMISKCKKKFQIFHKSYN